MDRFFFSIGRVFCSGVGERNEQSARRLCLLLASRQVGGREGRRRAVKWDNVMTSTPPCFQLFSIHTVSANFSVFVSPVFDDFEPSQFPPGARSITRALHSHFLLVNRLRACLCVYVVCVRVCVYIYIDLIASAIVTTVDSI